MQKGSTRDLRRNLLEQFQPLYADRLLVGGKPRDIAARSRYACHKSVGHGVAYVSKYDWDGARRPLQRRQGGSSNGDKYVRPQFNQFCRGGTHTVRSSSEAIIDPDVATLYPPELLQFLASHCGNGLSRRKILGACLKPPDQPHPLALLRPRRQRPSCRRRAEEREEGAAVQGWVLHSITSSARRSTISGTCRPNAFAVFILRASRYFVGAFTGKSARLSPLRILST